LNQAVNEFVLFTKIIIWNRYLKRASLWFEKRNNYKTFVSKSLFTCDCYSVIKGFRLLTRIKVWLFERPVNESWNLFLKICRWSDYHLPRSAQLTNLNKKNFFFREKNCWNCMTPTKNTLLAILIWSFWRCEIWQQDHLDQRKENVNVGFL